MSFFFFSSRRRHTRLQGDWSSDVCSSDLVGGIDPRNGRSYTYIETIAGGQGGRPMGPGMDGVQCNMTNTMNTPIEALEISYPLRVERYELLEGTGGAGR